MTLLTQTSQTASAYLVFGAISETTALMLFGIGLIVLTVSLRWLISRRSSEKINTTLEEAPKR